MGAQELHLVGEYSAPFQINVFCMGRHERDGQELHAGLLRCAVGLEVIAAFAGGDHVVPGVLAADTAWADMITRQIAFVKVIATIQAQVVVALEQRIVGQRWNVAVIRAWRMRVDPQCGHDGVDLNLTALTSAIDTPVHHE